MTTGFPLVLLPRRVVYVDDDGRMLDILRMTMPKQISREFIASPEAALKTLSQEAEYWRSIELALSQGHEQSVAADGQAPTYVKTYFQDWRRFHLTGVLIVDYAMPGLNGVELVRRLAGFPARRILLTGEADAEVAVQAFNSGLIQKFIPKGTPNLHKEITRSADEMHQGVCEQVGQVLRSTLRHDQVQLLQEPSVMQGLTRKVQALGWMEYLVVGNPFGLLGMAHGGPLQWLQIETAASLKDLAAALAEYGYPQADVQAAATCTAAPVREIRQQFGMRDDRQLVATDEISAQPEVYAALIDLPATVLTAREYGVDDIRTPEEHMRALLRDVGVAARRASEPGADANMQRGLDDALANVVATATLSQIHARALATALGGSALSPELAARVRTQVGLGLAGGKKNGGGR